ncbi:hypothetical protein ACS5PN_10870 [Roseateles sp. NT4]|uniref:hypothetical protein n=1 Tax=Roseateles sp. NT4 TaxID=3453715 RepID=UPI003EEE4324
MSTARIVAACVACTLVVAYAAFAIPAMLRFQAYCRRVARLLGREKDLDHPAWVDDGGMTPFDHEQLDALDLGSYKQLADPELVRLGDELASKMLWMRGLGVALVVTIICLASWVR